MQQSVWYSETGTVDGGIAFLADVWICVYTSPRRVEALMAMRVDVCCVVVVVAIEHDGGSSVTVDCGRGDDAYVDE